MRGFFRVCLSLVLSIAALAADVTIKVVDPQSAAVSGAQVALLRMQGDQDPRHTERHRRRKAKPPSNVPAAGSYQVQVLAPGFAAADRSSCPNAVRRHSEADVSPPHRRLSSSPQLELRFPPRPPAPHVDANTDNLETMQPVAASDAVRFLPGAVVSTSGQRGGLSSLFVRGGDSNYNKVIVDGVPVNEPGGIFDFGTVPIAEADRLEFLRGAQSTLYGSDAMTSVVQVFTRTGTTTHS